MAKSPLQSQGDGTSRAQNFAARILAGALLLLGLYTLRAFIDALAWAGIFAIALWPAYCRAKARYGMGHHNILLPALFTLGVAFLFMMPLLLIGVQLASESHAFTSWLHSIQRNGIPEPRFLSHMPFGQTQIDDWWAQNLADPGSASDLVGHATEGHITDIGRLLIVQLVRRVTLFLFALLTVFFLFKGGDGLTQKLRHAVARAFGPTGERMALQIVVSVHGTVDGLVLVGLGEGVLLGVVYALAGVPSPALFGVLTAIAAMIPFGAPLVFGMAALLLVAQGATVWAMVVFGAGMAVTFTADHFVRPRLIGDSTKLPFLWVRGCPGRC